ncbi:hypothetical protein [Saccharothrix syringae]|uniref:Uncharacterized protein n=1 Tax=Saccharothrix syringae TaxID=103733 RepID=A0A5Q0GS49_SACSY|nr:hypothetical protein [Saccharothrix syringae]QFZ16887.1 hypothetical protein EKG83_04855 [Saccharothrix syringae]
MASGSGGTEPELIHEIDAIEDGVPYPDPVKGPDGDPLIGPYKPDPTPLDSGPFSFLDSEVDDPPPVKGDTY